MTDDQQIDETPEETGEDHKPKTGESPSEQTIMSSRSNLIQAMEARKAKAKERKEDNENQKTVMASRSALEKARADRMRREQDGGDRPDLKSKPEQPASEGAERTVALNRSNDGPEEPPSSGDKKGKRNINIDPSEAHVLVVEDNVPNFVLIARLLAYMGVQRCEWKTSGWQVVEFADTLPRIDLILMDIRLPYEDGYQALQRVRANPRLKETLVIAVTAEADSEQLEKAKRAGFDGFLAKPLDPDRFPEQIKRVLRGEAVWELNT